MSEGQSGSWVRVMVSRDGLRADLVIEASAPLEEITPEICLGHLYELGLRIDDEAKTRVQELIVAAGATPDEATRATILTGMPPQHGQDGRVEWHVEEPEPESEGDDADGASEGEGGGDAVCFYSRSAFVMVKAGQVLGKVTVPTEGRGGRDVAGRQLAARSGKPARMRFDDSIRVDDDGTLTAKIDGMLDRTRDSASIKEFLEITGYVDFETGNIDFPGAVQVRKGVRDLFEVRCGGTLDVAGLVEMATIVTGGDFTARRGMAGREKGRADVGGDLMARYLHAITFTVNGDLRVDREVMNCRAWVRGKIDMPNGPIIGGKTACVGPIEVGALGSRGHAPTYLVLGSVPGLEDKLARLEQAIEQLEKRPSAAGKLPSYREAHEQLVQRIEAIRTVDVRINKMLHAGVKLEIGQQIFHVRKDMKGPIRICRDRSGVPVFRDGNGGGGGPLALIAEVMAATERTRGDAAA